MSHRSVNRFNAREVARAVKAARLAGEQPDRVEIDPATGTISVILARADSVESAAGAKAWDEATAAIERKSKVSKSAPTRR